MSTETDFILACAIVAVGSLGMTGFVVYLAKREGKLPPWKEFRGIVWRNFVERLRNWER